MPDIRETMIAGPLQNVSIAYKNQTYIADLVAPIIENVPVTAKITVYPKGAWFRNEAGVRARGTQAPRGGFNLKYLDIVTSPYAYASPVTDEDRRDATMGNAPPIKPDADAIELATDKVDLYKEKTVADLIFGGTWCGVTGGTDLAGSWAADAATNTFIQDIDAKIEMIRKRSGRRPNRLLFDAVTHRNIRNAVAIREIVNEGMNTQTLLILNDTMTAIKRFFNLDEVLIGDAIENTAQQNIGDTDWTAADVWERNSGKGSAFLYYAPKSSGLKTPSALYQARTPSPAGTPRQILKWREPAEHQDVYEVSEETCIIQCDSDLGYLWVDTIAT